jgi:hypothetical protein
MRTLIAQLFLQYSRHFKGARYEYDLVAYILTKRTRQYAYEHLIVQWKKIDM